MRTNARKKLCAFIVMLCLLLTACASDQTDREVKGDTEANETELLEQPNDSNEDIADEDADIAAGDGDIAVGGIDIVTGEELPVSEEDASVPLFEGPAYISQNFFDFMENWFQEKEVSALSELVLDQELTDQELEAYADDPVVAEHISDADSHHGGLFLKVDGDNDGIEDIFAVILDGGSSGNNTQHFLKGQADGSFQCIEENGSMTQELAFVSYEGTTYLLETDLEYNRKVADGFIISLYQDGELMESILMTERMTAYEPEIIYQAEGYEEVAAQYAEEGRNGFWASVDYRTDFSYETGSAETREDTDEACDILGLTGSRSMYYRSDFDNDGEQEWYEKFIFYPSSLYAVMHLEEGIYQEGGGNKSRSSLLETYALEYEGIPLYFWVDTVGDRQIVFLCSYQGLDKEYLYGYLIEEDQAQKVLEIEYTGISEISCRELFSMDGDES